MGGKPCLGLYIVQDGWLSGYKLSPSGRGQVTHSLAPGDAFNEVGVLAEGKNSVTVQALEPSTVWVIQREALLRLMEAIPHLCRLITQNLADEGLIRIERHRITHPRPPGIGNKGFARRRNITKVIDNQWLRRYVEIKTLGHLFLNWSNHRAHPYHSTKTGQFLCEHMLRKSGDFFLQLL